MRRTTAWGGLALYPTLAVLLGASVSDGVFASLGLPGPVTRFFVAYWWIILGVPAAVLTVAFFAHAALGVRQWGARGVLWAAGILLLEPLVIPAYWWQCSEAT